MLTFGAYVLCFCLGLLFRVILRLTQDLGYLKGGCRCGRG